MLRTPATTRYEPEYYQLDIFAGALRRRGLERFQVAVSPIPALASSRVSTCSAWRDYRCYRGTPAQQASLFPGDVIVFADGAPFQPVQSFRDKIAKSRAGLRRRRVYANIGYPGRY
jgi:carboxyl-terminal processing protease